MLMFLKCIIKRIFEAAFCNSYVSVLYIWDPCLREGGGHVRTRYRKGDTKAKGTCKCFDIECLPRFNWGNSSAKEIDTSERMVRSGRGKKFHPRYSIKRKKSFRNRITRPRTVVNVFPRPIAIFLGQGANWLNRTHCFLSSGSHIRHTKSLEKA
ncbi:hypothetical protein PUN28_011673 [Cardiocondyla obscurior]|uniref:Uncharacterized protein n=1 Tax=Cardiocondyla obscurior TaxID=286306 RepID=A0AAW2FIE1_9HYME